MHYRRCRLLYFQTPRLDRAKFIVTKHHNLTQLQKSKIISQFDTTALDRHITQTNISNLARCQGLCSSVPAKTSYARQCCTAGAPLEGNPGNIVLPDVAIQQELLVCLNVAVLQGVSFFSETTWHAADYSNIGQVRK